ncbi:MAG TPA: redoxin domain-containing protein [Herpetosiphonaceae bacterium]
MSTFFWASYVALWLLIVPLVILNLLLFRQVGIMVMGTARGVNQSGIPAGRRLPAVNSVTIHGKPWSSESVKGRPHVLLFGSTTCKECSAIMPDLSRVQTMFGVQPILLMFSDIEQSAKYAERHNLSYDVIIASQELGAKFDVEVSPFAYGVDSQGIIRAKGLVNSRRQLEAIAQAALGDEYPQNRPIIQLEEAASAESTTDTAVNYG